MTHASVEEVERYAFEGGYGFSFIADAGAVEDAWGIQLIWGNVVRLVDPDRVVVAEGVREARDVLESR